MYYYLGLISFSFSHPHKRAHEEMHCRFCHTFVLHCVRYFALSTYHITRTWIVGQVVKSTPNPLVGLITGTEYSNYNNDRISSVERVCTQIKVYTVRRYTKNYLSQNSMVSCHHSVQVTQLFLWSFFRAILRQYSIGENFFTPVVKVAVWSLYTYTAHYTFVLYEKQSDSRCTGHLWTSLC